MPKHRKEAVEDDFDDIDDDEIDEDDDVEDEDDDVEDEDEDENDVIEDEDDVLDDDNEDENNDTETDDDSELDDDDLDEDEDEEEERVEKRAPAKRGRPKKNLNDVGAIIAKGKTLKEIKSDRQAHPKPKDISNTIVSPALNTRSDLLQKVRGAISLLRDIEVDLAGDDNR